MNDSRLGGRAMTFLSLLERLQELDQIRLLAIAKREPQHAGVVRDDFAQVREPPVMVEAPFLADEKTLEGCRPVELLVGRTARLEVVDTDFLRCVHWPTRLRVERRDVTRSTLGLSLEERPAARRRRGIESAFRRLGRPDRALVLL